MFCFIPLFFVFLYMSQYVRLFVGVTTRASTCVCEIRGAGCWRLNLRKFVFPWKPNETNRKKRNSRIKTLSRMMIKDFLRQRTTSVSMMKRIYGAGHNSAISAMWQATYMSMYLLFVVRLCKASHILILITADHLISFLHRKQSFQPLFQPH